MDRSPNLSLPYLAAAQAQKHVTHNEALRVLDAVVQVGALSRALTAPPASPDDGDCYLIGAAPTGDWAGHAYALAAFQDGAWAIYEPKLGWLAWIADEAALVTWDGSAWVIAGGGSGGSVSINPAARVGVNATADDTNRLSVKSDAVLFSHDDVTPGSGDHRIAVNKAASANTASVVFQDNFSGRAEFGLAGDDDWHVKVSADGSTWFEALVVDRATGRVSLPLTPLREGLAANRTYYVRTDGSDSNNGLANSSGGAFLTIQHAIDVAAALDLSVFSVTIQVADGTYAGFSKAGPWIGGPASGAPVSIVGNSAIPANVVISATSGDCIACADGAYFNVSGMKLTAAAGSGVASLRGGTIGIVGPMEYGACSWAHRNAGFGGRIIGSNQKCLISGSALFHFYTVVGGLQQAQVYSFMVANSPAFAQSFAHSVQGSVIYANASTTSITTNGTTTNGSAVVTGIATTAKICVGAPVSGTGIPGGATVAAVNSSTQITLSANATASGTVSLTFGGSATGKRYNVASNGSIDIGGGGEAFLPGSIAGTNVDGTGAYG